MTSNLKSHPSSDVLECYSLGNLSETEVEQVEDHLFVCARCQDELAQIDSYIQDLKEACQEVERRTVREPAGLMDRLRRAFALPRPVWAGALAALLVAVILPLTRFETVSRVPAEVRLSTIRGADSTSTQAAARRPLLLQLDISTLSPSEPFRAEIVNHSGSPIRTEAPVRDGAHLSLAVRQPLAPGRYWVRLYDPSGSLVREYGLELK